MFPGTSPTARRTCASAVTIDDSGFVVAAGAGASGHPVRPGTPRDRAPHASAGRPVP